MVTETLGSLELTDFISNMYAIISLHDKNYQPLADLTWDNNKVEYANAHGYLSFCKTDGFNETSSIGYQKIHFVKQLMEDHPEVEWFWWTGTDTMVTNFKVKMEHRIDNNYHFIIAVDVNGLNADSFLIRNSEQGHAIIDRILELEPECSKFWDCEQRAMAVMFGLPVTAAPWPVATSVPVTGPFADYIKVVPQRFMNSYNYQFYQYKDHRDKLSIDGNWNVGDWLIHWPATNLEQRLQLARFYSQYVLK